MRIRRQTNTAKDLLKRSLLSYQLTPISLRELLYIDDLPCDLYGIKEGRYQILLRKGAFVNKHIIRDLVDKGHLQYFVDYDSRENIILKHQENLRKVIRSLSVGDPFEKGRNLLNLITINLEYLYLNPTDDEALKLQLQAAKSLANFLMENIGLQEKLYNAYMKQKHHFIFAQPVLSSFFLLGVMKMSHMFSSKDIENLFVTSFFKDIGMSAIPTEKYEEENLSEEDKIKLSNHAKHSVNILQGRIPIGANYLKIIENHHAFSLLAQDLDVETVGIKGKDTITGFETMLVNMMDVVSAAIQDRPFRAAINLFEALELVKVLIADQYPQEFKIIVSYFRNFFFKNR